MSTLLRALLFSVVCLALLPGSALAAGEKTLRVAVFENSPPMAFRDAKGEPRGFSIGVIRALGLSSEVMHKAELGGDVAFAVAAGRHDLKEQIDAALERIKRNGTYDRVNSQFLPFRIN